MTNFWRRSPSWPWNLRLPCHRAAAAQAVEAVAGPAADPGGGVRGAAGGVAARSGTFHDGELAGGALIGGAAVAAVLSWIKAPFLVIVGAAVAVTAGLRFAGLG